MSERTSEVAAPRLDTGTYSAAFGFYSFIHGDVDSRTGMYSARVELSSGLGNRLRGPGFSFRLAFSALEMESHGFGIGWRLAITEYDTARGMLTLSDGDTQRVTRLVSGGYCLFPDRKVDSCTLFVADGGDEAIVEHATGVVEQLKNIRGTQDLMRPVRITQSNGDSITLEWVISNGIAVLGSVTDDEGTQLLAIDYGTRTTLSINTGSAAPLVVHFTTMSNELQTISVPMLTVLNSEPISRAEEVQWKFTYRGSLGAAQDPPLLLLQRMESPDGMVDVVTYDDQALTLPPNGPRLHMPAVIRLQQSTSAGESPGFVADRHFRWDIEGYNFFGYPRVTSWQEGQDELLHMPGPDTFSYVSNETRKGPDGKVLTTVVRTYNRFHLVTEEVTTRGAVVQQISTRYGDKDEENLPFEKQGKSFQLPRTMTTTIYSRDDPDVRQVTLHENTYEDGNLVRSHDSATGITEVSTYYPVAGAGDACPPDPLGLAKRLASTTTLPGPGGGHVSRVTYEYCKVPLRTGTGARFRNRAGGYYIQAHREVLTVDDEVALRLDTHFVDRPGSDDHGTVEQEVRTLDGKIDTWLYAQSFDASSNTITTTTTHRSSDTPPFESTTSETKHALSGLLKSRIDASGNRTDYTYDALGRPSRQTRFPGMAGYETMIGFAYQLARSGRWVQRTGITGLKHKTWYDEMGRVIREEEPLPDGSLVPVREVLYNVFGQPATEKLHDVIPALNLAMPGHASTRADTDATLTLETGYDYDDWGQPNLVRMPDGSRSVTERTLVSVDTPAGGAEVWTRSIAWVTSDADPVSGAWQSTDTDAAGRTRVVRVGSAESGMRAPAAAGRFAYDGLGRCIEQTDAMGHVTRQAWDTHGRLATTTLPNGDVVTRTYAPGQASDLPASIGIIPAGTTTPVILGRREYDGLGRLTLETAGSLTHRFDYVDGQASSSVSHLPGGGKLRRTYDSRLGEVLLDETLDGDPAYVKTAAYDTRLGLPSRVSSGVGSMTITADYLGRMTQQELAIAGEPARSSTTTVSLGGRELVRRGVDNVVQHLVYDSVGRLASASDDDVTVTLTYDGVSRLASRATLDIKARLEVEQRISYDAFGRPARTTFRHDNNGDLTTRVLVLSYREDNKVAGKQWFDGKDEAEALRKETMGYDERGRLVEHVIDAVTDDEHPKDEQGNAFRLQRFTYGALDNLLDVVTTLKDGRVNTTTYRYDAVDCDRVIGLSNTLAGYPGVSTPITLQYDGNGNLVDDGQGHLLTWDDSGRIEAVTLPDGKTLHYDYGPDGRVARIVHPARTTVRYHSDGRIYCEFTGDDNRRYIRVGNTVVAETQLASAVRTTWLLGSDAQGSILTESTSHASVAGTP